MKNHSHKEKKKGFLPTHTTKIIITAYNSFTMLSDLSSGRQAAGNRLYEFFMLRECALVSVATQGSPCVIRSYPTCSAINLGMCSKSVTSLKHQSHCVFADGL